MNPPSALARLRPFRPVPFGRYTLLSHLATGGMGEIYLARLEGPQGFEKLCIIKKILPQLAADAEFVERFVGEARILVRLAHGSIAQVLDMGVHEDEAYMALEYVDGKDLRRVAARLRDRGQPVPLAFALFIMGRVLDALAYAHRKRDEEEQELLLVHRDVSPQNILVSYEGEVKVIDFGLAKSRLTAAKTHPNILLGKFLYMSPEQRRHQAVDRRSDLYAVGLCLYELLAGRHPFDQVPPQELMDAVASPRFAPLQELQPSLPASVAQLVMRALSVEPAQRFQSAEEFRGRLMACLMEVEPQFGPELVSQLMRELFATEYQAERRMLSGLREAGRSPPEPEGAEGQEVMTRLEQHPVRSRNREEVPLAFQPTPRSREEGWPKAEEVPTRPGLVADEDTRPSVPFEVREEVARPRSRAGGAPTEEELPAQPRHIVSPGPGVASPQPLPAGLSADTTREVSVPHTLLAQLAPTPAEPMRAVSAAESEVTPSPSVPTPPDWQPLQGYLGPPTARSPRTTKEIPVEVDVGVDVGGDVGRGREGDTDPNMPVLHPTGAAARKADKPSLGAVPGPRARTLDTQELEIAPAASVASPSLRAQRLPSLAAEGAGRAEVQEHPVSLDELDTGPSRLLASMRRQRTRSTPALPATRMERRGGLALVLWLLLLLLGFGWLVLWARLQPLAVLAPASPQAEVALPSRPSPAAAGSEENAPSPSTPAPGSPPRDSPEGSTTPLEPKGLPTGLPEGERPSVEAPALEQRRPTARKQVGTPPQGMLQREWQRTQAVWLRLTPGTSCEDLEPLCTRYKQLEAEVAGAGAGAGEEPELMRRVRELGLALKQAQRRKRSP